MCIHRQQKLWQVYYHQGREAAEYGKLCYVCVCVCVCVCAAIVFP